MFDYALIHKKVINYGPPAVCFFFFLCLRCCIRLANAPSQCKIMYLITDDRGSEMHAKAAQSVRHLQPENQVVLEPFGLASYKFKRTIWTSTQESADCNLLIQQLQEGADTWIKQLNVYHPDLQYFMSRRGTWWGCQCSAIAAGQGGCCACAVRGRERRGTSEKFFLLATCKFAWVELGAFICLSEVPPSIQNVDRFCWDLNRFCLN